MKTTDRLIDFRTETRRCRRKSINRITTIYNPVFQPSLNGSLDGQTSNGSKQTNGTGVWGMYSSYALHVFTESETIHEHVYSKFVLKKFVLQYDFSKIFH